MNFSTKTFLKKAALIATCSAFTISTANALNYTAIASGNFSSALTWSGGLIPPSILNGDNITILSGVNVTLDQTQTLNNSNSQLTVNGTLTSTNNSDLIITSGMLSGAGSITVDSMDLGTSALFNFSGNLTSNALSVQKNITSTANITVNNTLRLMSGTFTSASGSLEVGQNSTIVISGGMLSTTGGTFGLSNSYDVRYEMNSSNTGLELNGIGLGDVTVNVSSGASVTLSTDMLVNGMLNITSGNLVLNNNDLLVTSNGHIMTSGSGNISSNGNSNISISTATGANTLSFTSGSTLSDLVLNLGGSNTNGVTLNSDLTVTGQLMLTSGMLNVGSNDLRIATGGTISGGSANSFVLTGTGGTLTMNVASGNSLQFQVGNSNGFAPIRITSNTGSASSDISVGVDAGVKAGGTAGSNLALTQPVVNATWMVSSSVSSNLNLNMQAMWSAGMEVNNFNRAEAYISHYTNGQWDLAAATSATASGNGMFSISRNNITSLSPFAVMGKNAITNGVNDIVVNNEEIVVYPNPAITELRFASISGIAMPLNVSIYDVAGRMVKSTTLNNINNPVSIGEMEAGMYYIHLNSANVQSIQKVYKQ